MLPLGQSIGRWGNYFNQEVYGAVDPNKIGLPISVFIQDTGKYHYALFLWEAILNAVLFALLYWFLFKYKGKRNGYATGLYFIGYGLIRLIMEPLRDAQYNLPLFGIPSLGMVWVSIALILGGLSIIAVLLVKDFKENAKDELEDHAFWLLNRLKELGTDWVGIENPSLLDQIAMHKYVMPTDTNLDVCVCQIAEAERGAIATYSHLIEYTEQRDPVTHKKMKAIIKDEETHLKEMEDFIQKINNIWNKENNETIK
jgi:ferritin-like protein